MTCAHHPNDAGTACRYCGLAAEPVPAATLTRLLIAAIGRASLTRSGGAHWTPADGWHDHDPAETCAAAVRRAIREAIATDGRGSAAHHAAIGRRDCGLTHRHPTH